MKLKDMGFINDEYVLRNGLKIVAEGHAYSEGIPRLCLYTEMEKEYRLTINNKFELEQLLKILGE